MVVPVDVQRSPNRWEVRIRNIADKPVLGVALRAGNEPEQASSGNPAGPMLLPGQDSVLVRADDRVSLPPNAPEISVEVAYRTIRGLEVRARWLCIPAIAGITTAAGFYLDTLHTSTAP